MKLLSKKLGIQYSGCFVHLLNLIVKRTFDCFGKIKKHIEKEDEILFNEEEEQVRNSFQNRDEEENPSSS